MKKRKIDDMYKRAYLHNNLDKLEICSLQGRYKSNPNVRLHAGDTLLMDSIIVSRLDMTKMILRHPDIDINMKSIAGETPLMYAVRLRRLSVIASLLSRKALDINAQNLRGDTALVCAAKCSSNSALKMILLFSPRFPWDCKAQYSSVIQETLKQWRLNLPRWNRFSNAHKRYPLKVNEMAVHWLMCCKRLGVFPKDIRYLIIEYIADLWRLN